jgi:hypothetical protein
MRFLFAAYCMMNNEDGDSLIGVYKRCLRIGLELHRRGHQVAIFCPGRSNYRDATVEDAIEKLHFINMAPRELFHSSSKFKRRCLRREIRGFAPDVLVIGEVPMNGALLDAAVVGAELGLPVVILDNAYRPRLAKRFVRSHGAMADGIVLMGPSSFHMRHPPDFYCGVTPLVSSSSDAADGLLKELELGARRLVTVLGYERKAQELAASLFRTRSKDDCVFLFVVPDVPATEARLAKLLGDLRKRVRIIAAPREEVLFGVLRRSQVVIGKCGFMQMSECLCLRTAFLGVHYRGCFSIGDLPWSTLRFVGQTTGTIASRGVRWSFSRLLRTDGRTMRHLHRGGFDGLEKIADFLEGMKRKIRDGVTRESARAGYTVERVRQALETRHPGRTIEVEWVRRTPMREAMGERIDCVVVKYRSGGRRAVVVLWGRAYFSRRVARRDYARAMGTDSERQVLYRTKNERLILEEDIGENSISENFS